MYKFCTYCGGNLLQNSKTSFRCKQCKRSLYLCSKPTVTIVPLHGSEMMVAVRAIEPEKGKYDFVGGFLNNGEDPLEGGAREFEEETGLKIQKSDLKYLGIWIDKYKFEGEIFFTINIVYTLRFKKKITPKGRDDVLELLWLPINTRKNFAFSGLSRNILLKLSHG